MKQKQKAKQPPKKREYQPRYKWEKGDYLRFQEIRFTLPWQFLYLCKLTGVTPHDVLDQFMNNLGQESWKRSPNDGVRQTAIDYFIQCGYGQDFYNQEDLRSMFRELDAIGSLWPRNGKEKLIDLHAKWRNKYHDHWFKKWYYQARRKKP